MVIEDIALSIESIIIVIELIVLLFLIWHIKELSDSSHELESLVKEMHVNHAAMKEETMLIREAVNRIESLSKPKPKKKRTTKKKK